jgi:hypothetical protein
MLSNVSDGQRLYMIAPGGKRLDGLTLHHSEWHENGDLTFTVRGASATTEERTNINQHHLMSFYNLYVGGVKTDRRKVLDYLFILDGPNEAMSLQQMEDRRLTAPAPAPAPAPASASAACSEDSPCVRCEPSVTKPEHLEYNDDDDDSDEGWGSGYDDDTVVTDDETDDEDHRNRFMSAVAASAMRSCEPPPSGLVATQINVSAIMARLDAGLAAEEAASPIQAALASLAAKEAALLAELAELDKIRALQERITVLEARIAVAKAVLYK